jgi:hypothetical protein
MPFTGRRMELTNDISGGRRKAHSFDLYTLTYAGSGNDDYRNLYYNKPSDNFAGDIGLS